MEFLWCSVNASLQLSDLQEVDDYVESRSGSTLLYIQVKHWMGSKATSKSKVLYIY